MSTGLNTCSETRWRHYWYIVSYWHSYWQSKWTGTRISEVQDTVGPLNSSVHQPDSYRANNPGKVRLTGMTATSLPNEQNPKTTPKQQQLIDHWVLWRKTFPEGCNLGSWINSKQGSSSTGKRCKSEVSLHRHWSWPFKQLVLLSDLNEHDGCNVAKICLKQNRLFFQKFDISVNRC